MSGKVYIILVNWNGVHDTLECLESVLRLDYDDYQIIVCDNDSTDGSVDKIVNWACGKSADVVAQNIALAHLVQPNVEKPVSIDVVSRAQAEQPGRLQSTARIVIIQTGANLGFAGANNSGMRFGSKAGDGAYFWLLNNDTVVEPNSLTAMVNRCRKANDKGIVGSTLVFYHKHLKIQALGVGTYSSRKALTAPFGANLDRGGVRDLDEAEPEAVAEFVVGASMLVPSCFCEEVGPMCEDYFIYFEELDWALRGARFGYSSLYARDSVVYHKVGSTTGRSRTHDLSVGVRYSYVNRLLFTRRNFPGDLPRVRLRILLEAMRALVKWRWREAMFAASLALRSVLA